jgi:hypothetical protein
VRAALTISISGRFSGSTTSIESINFFSLSEYGVFEGCLYRPDPTAMAMDEPSVSNGEWP